MKYDKELQISKEAAVLAGKEILKKSYKTEMFIKSTLYFLRFGVRLSWEKVERRRQNGAFITDNGIKRRWRKARCALCEAWNSDSRRPFGALSAALYWPYGNHEHSRRKQRTPLCRARNRYRKKPGKTRSARAYRCKSARNGYAAGFAYHLFQRKIYGGFPWNWQGIYFFRRFCAKNRRRRDELADGHFSGRKRIYSSVPADRGAFFKNDNRPDENGYYRMYWFRSGNNEHRFTQEIFSVLKKGSTVLDSFSKGWKKPWSGKTQDCFWGAFWLFSCYEHNQRKDPKHRREGI